jgi:formylglycine-generating enzyme required for sulfatase activity
MSRSLHGMLILGLACGSLALEAPQVTISATSDGIHTHVQLDWATVDSAHVYEVWGRTIFAGEDSLLVTTTETGCELLLPTGWDWQSQPDVAGFFAVVAIRIHPEPSMVLVPAGGFMMGQTGVAVPEHEVSISRAFLLGRTEVTNGEYAEALQWAYDHPGQTGLSATPATVQAYGVELLNLDDPDCEISFEAGLFSVDPGREQHPVIEVSWYGAACYCDWISLMSDLPAYYNGDWSQIPVPNDPYSAPGYRLPTEAEWEYAAQFNDERLYPWGNTPPAPCVHANYDDCLGWTAPVGSHPAGASALGLQDLAGNVWEWCNDWWGTYEAEAVTDPPGPAGGSNRVIRGGSWTFTVLNLRCAHRGSSAPANMNHNYGFRLCRTAAP